MPGPAGHRRGVHAVGHNYTEIGAWIGILAGFVLGWPVVRGPDDILVLGILIGKLGKKKGAELDAIYRDVAWG